jgi:hypothetical protein
MAGSTVSTASTTAGVSAGALAVRQTRSRYKQRKLRQINTILDEEHSKLFTELVSNCDGYATKRTIQEALDLLHKVRMGQLVVCEKQEQQTFNF